MVGCAIGWAYRTISYGGLRHNYYDYLKYNKHLVVIFVIMFDPSLLDLANFLGHTLQV
jgi:hypothetical protein